MHINTKIQGAGRIKLLQREHKTLEEASDLLRELGKAIADPDASETASGAAANIGDVLEHLGLRISKEEMAKN